MKKITLLAGIFLMILSGSFAQDSTVVVKDSVATAAPVAQEAEAAKTEATAAITTASQALCPTAAAIAAKYHLLPMPAPMTIEQIFPAIGDYQPTAAPVAEATATEPAAKTTEEVAPVVASNVKIMIDEQNKGIVWVEGLPQGKIKGYLRKSPSTYKIPAQKTEEGTDVKEGTLIYDLDTKSLSIILGKPYNNDDPAASFLPAPAEEVVAAAPKVKKAKNKKSVKPVKVEKPWVFVGTKIETTTAAVK